MASIDDFSVEDICEVSPKWLRGLFAELDLWGRSIHGDVRTLKIADGHPSPADSGEEFCTRSQRIGYFDANGNQIAQVHQYVHRNGSLGGSGRPDPKLILHEGTLYGVL
jgi:hypothetical protein